MDPTVGYSADPYGERFAWRSELLTSAEAFLDADDALKRANEELKPYRTRKREGKDKVQEIMEQQRLDKLALQDRRETLVMVSRTSKRRPNAEELEQRCVAFTKGDEAAGKRLYDYLFKPIVQVRLAD